MTDALTPYRDTYGKTEETLHRIEGLSFALYDLAMGHPTLGSSDPTCEAIVTLMLLIEEKTKQAMAEHEAEWGLVVKPQPAA